MKKTVVEIRGKYAAVLSENGCIERIRNNNYVIGQEVDSEMKTNNKKIAVLAAAACLALILGIGASAYYIPVSYVSVDVNPSLEYKLNSFERVISVKGVNDDGTQLLEAIGKDSIINKPVDEAVTATVEELVEQGYLDGEDAEVVITTSANNMEKAEVMATELEQAANQVCENNNCCFGTDCEAVGKERVKEANELGVTPGKLRLVEKLIESSADPDSVDKEEWLNKSVKEINSQINENSQNGNSNSNANNGNTNSNADTNTNGNTEKNGNATTSVTEADAANGNTNSGSGNQNSGKSSANSYSNANAYGSTCVPDTSCVCSTNTAGETCEPSTSRTGTGNAQSGENAENGNSDSQNGNGK